MKRKIVRIDEEKCDGCGLCVSACAEGAIELVDGKARLVSDVYCDGLGACLGDCPQGAITIEEREAADFDEAAVAERLRALGSSAPVTPAASSPPGAGFGVPPLPGFVEPLAAGGPHAASHGHAGGSCPGSAMRVLSGPPSFDVPGTEAEETPMPEPVQSELGHWPVQIMLVPPHAPFLRHADLLVCADCVPFALPGFHRRYLKGKAVLVGCPKLDDLAFYREKLRATMAMARPVRVTVLRMEVPCCGGIAHATVEAIRDGAPDTPVEIHTIGVRGDVRVEKLPGNRAAV